MIVQYIKQAWHGLKERQLQSRLAILGTSLSICMIMALVLVDQVKYGPFAPETNRREMLIVKQMTEKSSTSWSMSGVGERGIKELFSDLQTTHKVAYCQQKPASLGLVGASPIGIYDITGISEDYWAFFDYHVVRGELQSPADIEAGVSQAVITDELARSFFRDADPIGKQVVVNGSDTYQIIGVVSKPSDLALIANGNMWVSHKSPFYAGKGQDQSFYGTYTGAYTVILMTDGGGSLKEVQEEVLSRVEELNRVNEDVEVDLLGAPDTYRVATQRHGMDPVDLSSSYTRRTVLLLLFFLVPAVNIATLTHSRMKKRIGEIGLRKAYGATRYHILSQVVWESLLYTVIGSVIGFVMAIIAVYIFQQVFFGDVNVGMSLWVLVRGEVVLLLVLIGLLLNIISAMVPAMMASRRSIINALERR